MIEASLTLAEKIGKLRACFDDPDSTPEEKHEWLDRIESELELSFWPDEVFAAAEAAFGRCVYARTGRTYQSLDRRIRHALRVWDEKYGPLNPAQNEYAATLLVHAIEKGAREAAGDRSKLYPFVQAGIGRLVNHERVDEGFKARAQTVAFNAAEALA